VGVRVLQWLAPHITENLGHWGHVGHKKGEKPGHCASLGREMLKRQRCQIRSRSSTPNSWVCQYRQDSVLALFINPLSPELNPICYLLALLAHDFLHVSRIRVKSLILRLLMSYIYMEYLFLTFLDHTQQRSTVGRTPLDE
jgi:hypothetical protein